MTTFFAHVEEIPETGGPQNGKCMNIGAKNRMFYMIFNRKNGHETDLEMSPRPLGTTVFEEIYIRTMGK